jgi:hypothetical protein
MWSLQSGGGANTPRNPENCHSLTFVGNDPCS